MRDADDATGDGTTTPPPRRRWGRRVVLALLVLLLLLAVTQWQSGRRATRGLAAEIAACRAAGEPATVAELNRWEGLRSGTGENAVPLLRAAGIQRVTVMSGPTSPDLTADLDEGVRVVTVDAWAKSHRWNVAVLDLG